MHFEQVKAMKEFLMFLWDRYIRRRRNVGYGVCRWACPPVKQRIYLDEEMCRSCYFDDYVMRFK